MFVVSLTYKTTIDEVEKYLKAHSLFLDEQYAQNKFIFSGRKNPRTGGLILAYNLTREELDEVLKQDPFFERQIADYEITEIIPTKYNKGFECFIEKV